MSIKTVASAWWLAWKWVVILAVLLALSLWGNGCQYKRSLLAPLKAENTALKEASDQSLALATEGQKRERVLLAGIDMASGQLQQAGKDYKRAVADRPLGAQCAPGQARVDAVNKALGQPQAKSGEVR